MVRSATKPLRLDEIDQNILSALTQQGRISNASLARQVGLSESATLERVRRLEKSGIILGYSARVVPDALGQGTMAIANLRMIASSPEEQAAALETLLSSPHVASCYRVLGPHDMCAQITAVDLAELDQILNKELRQISGIQILETMVVTRALKEHPWPR